jgi:hypothetical protein
MHNAKKTYEGKKKKKVHDWVNKKSCTHPWAHTRIRFRLGKGTD